MASDEEKYRVIEMIVNGQIDPTWILREHSKASHEANVPIKRSLQVAVDVAECEVIKKTLDDCGHDRDVAAARLGLNPVTLWRKMKRLGIEIPKTPQRP